MERGLKFSSTGEKGTIKIYHSQKPPEGFCICGTRKVLDGGDFVWKRSGTFGGNLVTEEVNDARPEHALLDVNEQAVVVEALEQGSEMKAVFCFVLRKDENVVDIGETKLQVACDLIDKSLEGLPSVPKTKRHVGKFEQPEGGDDRGLRYVLGVHGYLGVGLYEVDDGEQPASVDPAGKVMNMADGVAIRDSSGV